jgi:FkbM family methyltransferase
MDAEVIKFLNWENGYFIELGASDGIRFSNTLHLELYHGWKGVLIEPSPIEFEKLKLNRSNLNSFENCVCVENGFKGETLELIYSGLMTVDTNKKLGVISPEEHAEAGAAFINIDTYRFHVKAVTLNNLLIENDSPREIDFLSLDVEGSELNVLKGLDLNFFVVKYILIETRDFEVIDLYLNPFGYKFVDKFSDQDFLFKRI